MGRWLVATALWPCQHLSQKRHPSQWRRAFHPFGSPRVRPYSARHCELISVSVDKMECEVRAGFVGKERESLSRLFFFFPCKPFTDNYLQVFSAKKPGCGQTPPLASLFWLIPGSRAGGLSRAGGQPAASTKEPHIHPSTFPFFSQCLIPRS